MKWKWTKREIIRAWIYKYIFRIPSPSACVRGYTYMWDLMKASKHDKIVSYLAEDGTEIKVIQGGAVIQIQKKEDEDGIHSEGEA